MWILLALSLIFLSWKKIFSLFALTAVLIIATFQGFIILPTLGILIVIFCIAFLHWYYDNERIIFVITEILLLITVVALFFHLIPGFNNPKILDKVLIGEHSTLFSMYFNLDKSLVTFVLFFTIPTLFLTKTSKNQTPSKWCVLILSVPVLLIIALLLGGLRIEHHFPAWIWQFVLANLFFVSLAEEALFRGYIQQRLDKFIGAIPALLIASILFGLIHYQGGYLLVIFSILAGIIYGIAWMWSGRLWVSAFFHFGLNLIHLLFFTYPAYNPHL
ncbi:CAAX protease family protein [Helicobacter sp. 13S00482-2]|uniref:CPBP family intramembrane glutamic endopeptidase n=1 Tax=Helicobacter sp. 13S00482-2 TaxID=1476200 RepID=UPI000BA7648A|nr:CPBP family intramembrane glutamic endopeptidase [Helicobacter sp. 13S00482-2]PAF54208.1 CAAX protease family protein [Helicobacter sp. 13S00482-2]